MMIEAAFVWAVVAALVHRGFGSIDSFLRAPSADWVARTAARLRLPKPLRDSLVRRKWKSDADLMQLREESADRLARAMLRRRAALARELGTSSAEFKRAVEVAGSVFSTLPTNEGRRRVFVRRVVRRLDSDALDRVQANLPSDDVKVLRAFYRLSEAVDLGLLRPKGRGGVPTASSLTRLLKEPYGSGKTPRPSEPKIGEADVHAPMRWKDSDRLAARDFLDDSAPHGRCERRLAIKNEASSHAFH